LRIDFGRDRTGLITEAAEQSPTGNVTWNYEYDGLKRLQVATQTGLGGVQVRRYEYEYDRNGNRLVKREVVGPVGTAATELLYSYNALDQMREERRNGSLDRRYNWDAMGRLLDERTPAGVIEKSYAWSVDDRLLGVGLPGQNLSLEYQYDHRGSRVRRYERNAAGTGPATERRYLADYENLTNYSQILAETDNTGTSAYRNYAYGQDHAATFQSGTEIDPSFFHTDHLGTTRALTSGGGLALASGSYSYSPYGEPLSGNAGLTNFHFTGQFKENASGLQWHRARWLRCSVAHWMSRGTRPTEAMLTWSCLGPQGFPSNFSKETGHGGARGQRGWRGGGLAAGV
jgi:hypothetical protein